MSHQKQGIEQHASLPVGEGRGGAFSNMSNQKQTLSSTSPSPLGGGLGRGFGGPPLSGNYIAARNTAGFVIRPSISCCSLLTPSGSADPTGRALPSNGNYKLPCVPSGNTITCGEIASLSCRSTQGSTKTKRFSENLSHTDAEPSHTDAELSHTDAEHSHTDAELSHTDAEHSHTDAEHSHTDAELSHTDAELSHTDAEPSHTDAAIANCLVFRAAIQLPLNGAMFRYHGSLPICRPVRVPSGNTITCGEIASLSCRSTRSVRCADLSGCAAADRVNEDEKVLGELYFQYYQSL
jgi:hypothetical protein